MEQKSESELASSTVLEKAREVVFLSHANPEDNDFVIWLGARLTELGYEVWTDLIRLKGGEPFWTDIEDVIRQKAAKVVLCLSRAAIKKEGVRNEIALAAATAKKLGPSFIIPIVIDPGFSYDDHLPAQVAQKNCISFVKNWAQGFIQLEELLTELVVPKPNKDLSHYVELWKHAQTHLGNQVIGIPQEMVTNWFPITELPESLTAYEILRSLKLNELSSLCKDMFIPAFPVNRFLFGHGATEDYKPAVNADLSIKLTISTEDFISGSTFGLNHNEAKKLYISLISRAWDRKLAELGLVDHEMANRTRAWFIPTSLLNAGQLISFTRSDGSKGKRCLVGRNNTKGVFWHFAISIKPNLHSPKHLQLSAHVVFTVDGKTPIQDAKKVQALRKATCKNWFNSKWRDLLLTYTAFLSQGEERISLPVGNGQNILLSSTPLTWTSPVSYDIESPTNMNDEAEIIEELKRNELDVTPFYETEEEDTGERMDDER